MGTTSGRNGIVLFSGLISKGKSTVFGSLSAQMLRSESNVSTSLSAQTPRSKSNERASPFARAPRSGKNTSIPRQASIIPCRLVKASIMIIWQLVSTEVEETKLETRHSEKAKGFTRHYKFSEDALIRGSWENIVRVGNTAYRKRLRGWDLWG